MDVANKRNDEWGKEVLKRLNSVMCLVSEESKYHKSCERRFCSTNPVDENKKRGRPQDEDLANAFSNLCDFLKSENECQFRLNFLHEKMEGTPNVYDVTFLSPSELHWMCAQWVGVIKCSGWNGFMETITDSREYQEMQICFLSFVNLPSSSLDCIHSVLIFAAQEKPQELTHEVLNLEKPKTYKIIFGTQRTTEIIQDNLGFLYYKNKKTENKIYLVCLEKKTENSCRATAHISPDQNDDKLVLCKQHNHQVRPFNEEVPLLRHKLTEKALQKSVCSYSSRGIYMEDIVNFPNAAQDYTFFRGSERMRRLRQKSFPATPDDIEDLHTLLIANSQFTLTLQNPSNKFYQGPLLINQQIKDQLLFLENQSFVEFRQLKQNLKIRNGGPTRARTANTEAIKDFSVDYTQDLNSDRLLSFLRRAGHRVDGYIIQEIGIH
ncbi:hypothetical protein ACI65C_013613 [Semiaphis heraclei]